MPDFCADPEASRQQRRSFRQMTCEVLFDKLKVPAICSVDQVRCFQLSNLKL